MMMVVVFLSQKRRRMRSFLWVTLLALTLQQQGAVAFRVQFRSGLPMDVPPILSKMAERQRFVPTVPVAIRHQDLVVAIDADTGTRVAWAQIRSIEGGSERSSSSTSSSSRTSSVGGTPATGAMNTPQWNGFFPRPQASSGQSPLNLDDNNNNNKGNDTKGKEKEKGGLFTELWESMPGAKKDGNRNGGNRKDPSPMAQPTVGGNRNSGGSYGYDPATTPRTTTKFANGYDSRGPAMFNVYQGTAPPPPGPYSTSTSTNGYDDPSIYRSQPGYNVPPRCVPPQTYGVRERMYSTNFFDQASASQQQQQQQSWSEREWRTNNYNNDERNNRQTASLWEDLLNTQEVRGIKSGLEKNHEERKESKKNDEYRTRMDKMKRRFRSGLDELPPILGNWKDGNKDDYRERRLYEEVVREVEYDKTNDLPSYVTTPEARQRKARLQELAVKAEELDVRRRNDQRRLEEVQRLQRLDEKKVQEVLWEHLVKQVQVFQKPDASPNKQQFPFGESRIPTRGQEQANQSGTQNMLGIPIPSFIRNTSPNQKAVLWELTSVAVLDPYRGQGIEEELIRSTIRHHFSRRPEDVYVFTSQPEWFKVNFGFSVLTATSIPVLMAAEFKKTSRLTPNEPLYCCVLRKGNQVLGAARTNMNESSSNRPQSTSVWPRAGQ